MRKLIAISFLFLFSITGSTQVYFNHRYDHLGSNVDVASGGFHYNNKYYAHGINRDTTGLLGLGFIRLDSLGNTEIKKFLPFPNHNNYSGSNGSFRRSLADVYGAAAALYDSLNHAFALFVGYNSDGDTLFTRVFGDTTVATYFYNLTPTLDSGFLCVGTKLLPSGYTDVLAVKYNKNGNQEWFNTFGGGDTEYAFSVTQLSDSSYVIGGDSYSFCGQNMHYTLCISKTGAFIWQKCYPNIYTSEGGVLLSQQLLDGNLFMFGKRRVTASGKYKNYLAKIDTLDGDIIWEKEYAAPSLSCSGFSQVKELPNHTLIASVLFYDSYGILYHLTENGDSLWRKDMRYSVNTSYSAIWDIDLVNGYEIFGVGEMNPIAPDTGNRDVWIFKLDAHGCDTICWPPELPEEPRFPSGHFNGIEESGSKNGIRIYPNPSEDYAYLEYQSDDPEFAPVLLEIYSLDGRKVYARNITSEQKQLFISTTELSAGTYFVCLKSNERLLTATRLFVLH